MQKIIRGKQLPENYFEEKCFITEVINDKTYPPFSIAKARVIPGVTTEPHHLTVSDEVYYILSGKGEVELDGKVEGVVEAGDAVFIPKMKTQRIKNVGPEDLIFLCVVSPRFDSENYKGL